jgi:hypothetical protein
MSLTKSVFLTGIFMLLTISANNIFAMSYNSPPQSIQDYIDTSDLIIVGNIGNIHKIHKFYGYQDNAKELAKLDQNPASLFALPMVDYEVNVQEIVKDDVLFPVNKQKTVILRVSQAHNTIFTDKNAKENQGKFLLFLLRNPDNETYGFYSFMHKARLNDNGKVTYLFEDNEYSVFNNINSNKLIEDIKRELIRQSKNK